MDRIRGGAVQNNNDDDDNDDDPRRNYPSEEEDEGDDDDQYDYEYDDNDDDDIDEKGRRPTQPERTNRYNDNSNRGHRPPTTTYQRKQQYKQQQKKKKKQQQHWTSQLATRSLQMTSSLAYNTFIKQPGKLAYYMIRPKYVEIWETDGLWRLDQQVVEKLGGGGRRKGSNDTDERVVASVATIELDSKRRMAILRKKYDGNSTTKTKSDSSSSTVVSAVPYTFTKTKISGSYQSSFVLPAFLIGDDTMRLYGYKGTWQRKVADRKVLKLVGKIYQVHKQRFGKNRGEYIFGQAVGTFVARRRIQLFDDEVDENDDDDDDDEEYEEDEGDDGDQWEDVDEDDDEENT